MKRLLFGPVIVTLFLSACQTANTQHEPQVITVPPDEMSRPTDAPAAPAFSGSLAIPATSPTAPLASPTASAVSSPAVAPTPGVSGKHVYNSCNVDGRYVAMTFDDGPHPELTPKLLDMLKARGIKATFYVVGQNVVEYPDIMKRMIAEGHEVGNHTWNHPSLTKLGAEGVRSQMDRTTDAIVKTTGVRPATMRPPYGATNASLNKRFDEQYDMKVIMWSIDPLDWKYRNASRVSSQIIEKVHPGAIILAHDIHPSTVAAMPAVFDTLKGKGYEFLTVSELLARDRPPAPKVASPTPAAVGAVATPAVSSPAASSPVPTARP